MIGDALKAYADRGVFRGFSERAGRGGRREFTFVWLTKRPLTADYDAAARTLTFRDLLTAMPARSEAYQDLKRLVANVATRRVPAHRAIDRRRARIAIRNRAGRVSIGVTARRGDEPYMVNRAVNLVHQIFLWLQESHAEYMWDEFDAPHE
jgi:hypothetical protein